MIWLAYEAAIALGVEVLRAPIRALVNTATMFERCICTLRDELILSSLIVNEEAAHPVLCVQKSIVLNWRIEESTVVHVRSTIR